MLKKYIWRASLVSALLLSGCGAKTEDIQKNIENGIPKWIEATAEEPTTAEENLKFYLPEESIILSATENNVAFETEFGDFVIFMNPVEEEDSKTNYEIVKDLNKDKTVFVDETLTENNGFQFVYIVQQESKNYEIYVGLGGVKASALVTKKSNLEPAVEQLVKVAKSVGIATAEDKLNLEKDSEKDTITEKEVTEKDTTKKEE